MKNSFFKLLLIVFIIFFNNFSLSDELFFDTETINIINNGKTTIAKNGKANFIDEKLEINGDFFEYDREKKILIVSNANSISKDDNISIKSKKMIYNRNTLFIKATGQVELRDETNNSIITSEELIYDSRLKKIISNSNAKLEDNFNNSLYTGSFKYDLKTSIVKMNSLKLVDSEKNEYLLKKGFLNTKSKKLIGKDVFVDLENATKLESNFRIKSLGIEKEQNKTILKKAVFTPCKKNETCPPWQISAETITHDEKKRTMYYKDAWLKIYDQKVLYFPKFFHPDPTVKRQSGFLIPSFSSSKSLGDSINIPYFKVVSDDKDFTIKPRLYLNNKLLAQTEYRQVGKKFNHSMDLSILAESDNSNRSHFFSKTKKDIDLNLFDESDITIDVQQVSNDSYLKSYKLNSPLIENNHILTSSIFFNGFNDDLIFNTELTIYEDLSKKNNDRYEVILPSYNLTKQIRSENNLKGSLEFNSSGSIKSYNTNVLEKVNINDLLYSSNPFTSKSGVENNFNFIIKNVNSESDNSDNFKNTYSSNLRAIAELASSFPLIKKDQNYTKLITPKISLRYNPNKTKDKKDELRQINYDNIYSLNRLGFSDTLEGGESLTYGSSYSLTNKRNRELLNLEFANVLRLENDENIPLDSSIGQKTSNFVSSIGLNPNDNFKINYQLSMDENLDETRYQLLSTDLTINNFVSSFEYLNETSNNSNSSYLYNKTSYNFNENNKLSFETRENKKEKITEFYNLIYQYRNDCLIAAIEYNKDYYNFQDLKPEEKLFFKLTIIPFGQTTSPSIY